MNVNDFIALQNPEKAKANMRFFRQTPDSYCKNDQFLGIDTKKIREFSKSNDFGLEAIENMLVSEYNDVRVLAWLLIEKAKLDKDSLYKIVLNNAEYCGNWNVVDTAAPIIARLLKDKAEISKLGMLLYKKQTLWSVRFSIVLSLKLIKDNEIDYALKITKLNLSRKEDMIRKPIGWMLREVGKKDENILIKYLRDNKDSLSATVFSYATEHLKKEYVEFKTYSFFCKNKIE